MTGVAARPEPDLRIGGIVWFALEVAGWAAFGALAVFSPEDLTDIWAWIRDLPLLLELLAWLLTFPYLLALAVWESGWDGWLRVAFAVGCALVWSALFFPRAPKSR